MAVTSNQIRDLLNRPRGLNENTITEYITIRTAEVNKKARGSKYIDATNAVTDTLKESAIKFLVCMDCLRVLIDTISGSKYSYGTGSFFNVVTDTSFLLTTSGAAAIIDNMPQIQYFNAKTNNTASFEALFLQKGIQSFSKTYLSTSPIQHFQFVSCSVADDISSGSLVFTTNSASISCSSNSSVANHGDRIKRYKFFGNKVCNSLGLPENYWIYPDKFRLTTSG